MEGFKTQSFEDLPGGGKGQVRTWSDNTLNILKHVHHFNKLIAHFLLSLLVRILRQVSMDSRGIPCSHKDSPQTP